MSSLTIISTLLCLLSLNLPIFANADIQIGEHHKHQYPLFRLEDRKKRGSNTCQFPTNCGLVAVNKDGTGGGWAISKDRTCDANSYCPYACPPGYLAAQWDPSATSYTYPQSQNGGLHCNSDGTLSKPFLEKDYCVKGKGGLSVNNKVGSNVAFCQTVLPGNEEMLIPTNVGGNSQADLSVPGTDYWASTAAHYYVNTPGVSVDDGCTWGSNAKAQGNWAPYVAGANQDSNGNTFVKIGWNPIYLDSFSSVTPGFGIRITCPDESKCNGLKCEIDPSQGVNKIQGSSATGAGGATFCVVTVLKGASALIEVFSSGSGSSGSGGQQVLSHKKREADENYVGNQRNISNATTTALEPSNSTINGSFASINTTSLGSSLSTSAIISFVTVTVSVAISSSGYV